MLEGRCFEFESPVQSSCKQESSYVSLYNNGLTVLGKRPSDGEDEWLCLEDGEGRRKFPKTSKYREEDEDVKPHVQVDQFNGGFYDSESSSGNSGETDEFLDQTNKSDVFAGGFNDLNSLAGESGEVTNFMEVIEQSGYSNGDYHDCDLNQLIASLGREISINCLLRCSLSDYGVLACLNRSFRCLVQSGNLYKLRREEGVMEHFVYFSCNVLQWDAFNPDCRRWMHLPSLPLNECFMCSDKESLAVGTELLLFGREVMSQIVYRYSILTNSWTSGAKMITPRCLFASGSLGDVAIVAGGCDNKGSMQSSAELYNCKTQTWMPLPSMNVPRKNCSGFFMDGRFFVVGGVNYNGPLTCGEEFDLETRSWRVIPNMFPAGNGAVGAPPLVAVVNNQLYAADHAEKELRKYDKNNNTWVILGKLPERSVSVNGWGLAFRACGKRLIVIGGHRAPTGGSIELYSWIPNDEPLEWKLIARKPSGSFVYNCAVMNC